VDVSQDAEDVSADAEAEAEAADTRVYLASNYPTRNVLTTVCGLQVIVKLKPSFAHEKPFAL
jgi:hypothetical protein